LHQAFRQRSITADHQTVQASRRHVLIAAGPDDVEQTNHNVQSLHALLAEFRAAGVILAQFNRTGQTDRSGNGMPDIT